MQNSNIHRLLISAATILWIITSFTLLVDKEPYSSQSLFITLILLITEILYWLRYYRLKKGYYPNINNILSNLSFNGGRVLVNSRYLLNHILEFWTILLLIVNIISLFFYLLKKL